MGIEALGAFLTLEWPLPSVGQEMIPDVGLLLEHLPAGGTLVASLQAVHEALVPSQLLGFWEALGAQQAAEGWGRVLQRDGGI